LAGTNINVAGTTASLGSVTAGKAPTVGNLTVKTTGNVTLGKLANQRQSATGAITVESTTGSILQGATGLTMTSNSDGSGAEALTLKAGSAIVMGDATLNGGAAQQSAVALTSGAASTIGKANAAAFTANAGDTFRANGAILAKENVAITATGGVNLANVTASGATRDITITTPGAIVAGVLTAGSDVLIGGGATSFRADTVQAVNGSIDVKAGATDIGTAVSGLNTRIAGTTAVLGNVTAGTPEAVGNLTVVTTGNTTLGKAANQKQSASGAISIESTAGSIRQGAAGQTLAANSNGAGGEALTLKAGAAIALDDATLNGGTAAQRSTIRLTSGTGTEIGSANASAFAAKAGSAFTANGPIVAAENAAITSGSTVTLNTVTTTGAGRDITISTPGAIAAGTLKATRNVTVAGGATSFRATTVDAANGVIDVRAGTTDIATATSGGNTRIAGNTVVLGTVTAGKSSALGGLSVLATGNVTLGKAANQSQSAAAGILIESANGSIQQGAAGLRLTSNNDGPGGEALTLKARNAIALGDATLNGGRARQSSITLTAGSDIAVGNASGARVTANAGRNLTANGAIVAQSLVSLTSGTDTAIGSASGQTVTAVARRDFTASRSISATGNASITATRKITTGGTVTAGNAVQLFASDATIGSAITAKTIDVTNTGRNALVIGGDAESVASRFTLSRVEAGRLRASETLTLGADGSDDVELKQVALTVPKTVRVLANGKRIDVTGRVSFDSNTTLQLGGDVASGRNNASIIQVTSDSGGRIDGADGRLEMGANTIVVGNNALIKTLDEAVGINAKIDVASALNRRAGSVLYNGGENQAVLVRAGSMKINFNGFALFQNTGTSLLGQGVSLGAPGATGVVLDLASTSTRQPVLAMFGSINGVVNNATALLGNPPLARYSEIALSRLNGCVIGGGNCLSVQNLTPSLTAVDNIRTSIFTVKPDFQVPFDPLVGTNNDALFDDVGSFGLGELPMAPIECSAPGGVCSTQKKDGK
uniref:beta strand repeat-containing protein n=1 Tax=Novosphingobium sp. TaxID=1874826 RepID=UPI00356354BB